MVALSSFCVWSQRPRRSRRITVLLWGFCSNTFYISTDSENVWCRGSIPSETILVLPKYFLNFGFYAVASESIVDLGRYGCKGYTSKVFSYSKVTFLGEIEDGSLCPSVCCVFVIYGVILSEQYVVEVPCLSYFWGRSSSPDVFFFQSFLSNKYIKCYPILFVELCSRDLWLTFLPILHPYLDRWWERCILGCNE